MDTSKPDPALDEPWVGDLNDQIQFADRGTVSKTLVDTDKTKVVLFAMKAGQAISGHAAGTPATIHVLRGKAAIRLGETDHEGTPGSFYYMPAGLYHSLTAEEDFVFLLDLFR